MIYRNIIIGCLMTVTCTSCAAQKMHVLSLSTENTMHFIYEIPKAKLCSDSPLAQQPELIDSEGDTYFVWTYKGAFYVLGSKSSSKVFSESHSLANLLKKENCGPNRETVFFEYDSENADLQKRLENRFNEPKLLRFQANNFFVWKVGKQIYLFGDILTNKRYIKFHEFPPERDALYHAGPNGENIIYEIREKDPDFSKFLLERYVDGPTLVSQSCDNFTIWKYQKKYYVISTPELNLQFETYHVLADSQAYMSFGPENETVIFEYDPGNPSSVNYLRNRFQKEMRVGASKSLPKKSS